MDTGNLELKINPAYRDLLPSLSDKELNELKSSIKREGCRDPIIVNKNNEIIDGHNRHAICQELGILFEVRIIEFDSEVELREWMIQTQLGRRNLTAFGKGEVVLRSKETISEIARANQRAAGGALPQKSAKAVDVRKELALRAGVSTDTVSKIEAIVKHANDDVKEKLRRGDADISINSAYKQIRDEVEKSKSSKRTTTKPTSMKTPLPSSVSLAPDDFFNRFEEAIRSLRASDGQKTKLYQSMVSILYDSFQDKNSRLDFLKWNEAEIRQLKPDHTIQEQAASVSESTPKLAVPALCTVSHPPATDIEFHTPQPCR